MDNSNNRKNNNINNGEAKPAEGGAGSEKPANTGNNEVHTGPGKEAEEKVKEEKPEKTAKIEAEKPKKAEPSEKPAADKAEKPEADEKAKKAAEAKKAAAQKAAAAKAAPKKKKSAVELPGERFAVTSSPHVLGKESTSKIMWTVSACLAPAGLAGIYLFGLKAFFIIFFCILGAVGAEYAWQKLMKQKITIADGSAFLTGLLLAYNLPPNVEWWLPIVGGAFAVIIVKQVFGGLGNNIFNPALAARGFLMASWPVQMTTWTAPVYGFFKKITDADTTATPLNLVKMAVEDPGKLKEFEAIFSQDGVFTNAIMFKRLLLGMRGGCIGETCAVLLILGALYLIYKKYIDWQIPAVYIGTVAVLSLLFGGGRGGMEPVTFMIFNIFSGGLILGAFYMATDYVSIPSTVKGRMIFALGCGVIAWVIRMWGGLPEGVCYSILIMNAFTPMIDDKVRPRVYGFKKEAQPA